MANIITIITGSAWIDEYGKASGQI
jgi:hypothetical protein